MNYDAATLSSEREVDRLNAEWRAAGRPRHKPVPDPVIEMQMSQMRAGAWGWGIGLVVFLALVVWAFWPG